MRFRYPDKPAREITRAALDDLKEDYFTTLKMDGWRCVIAIGLAPKPAPFVTYTSRSGAPLPLSGAVQQAFEEQLAEALVPAGTVLDGEWLGRRAGQLERIWLFDALQIGGKPLYHLGPEQRFEALLGLYSEPHDLIVPCAESGYGDFFDRNRNRADAEGIVLKRFGSHYIGSSRACADNPAWIKCKWRGGENGQTPLPEVAGKKGGQDAA